MSRFCRKRPQHLNKLLEAVPLSALTSSYVFLDALTGFANFSALQKPFKASFLAKLATVWTQFVAGGLDK